MKRFLLLLCLPVLMAACRSGVDPGAGALTLSLNHVVNGDPLVLNTKTYQNKSGETFTISKFDYFLTNIRLLRADGSAFTVPQDDSYFLIRSSDLASQQLELKNIPAGTYSQIEYMLGVDSLRNTADPSRWKGVLDPGTDHTSGMYWSWNTGFIHLKLEGTSPNVPANATNSQQFVYHIGLFGGYQSRTLNNLRTVRVPLGLSSNPTGNSLRVGADLRTQLMLQVDAGKVFDGPTPIRMAQYPNVLISDASATIATNYATMFTFGFSSSESK